MSRQVITIDGPAASGKTSVSREVARRLGWVWVSTGAFYRGLAYVALEIKIDLTSSEQLVALAHNSMWKIQMTPQRTLVLYRDQDVTDHIGTEVVGGYASQISHLAPVRQALLGMQRQCAFGEGGLIAEGRDCGTVVFPTAQMKFYLTASSERRALRRAEEFGEDPAAIADAQKKRDTQDSERKTAPLSIPADAVVIDTSTLGLDQVVERVYENIQHRLKS